MSFFHLVAVIFSSKSILGGGLKLPNCETSETKWCTSVVARVSPQKGTGRGYLVRVTPTHCKKCPQQGSLYHT